MDGDDWQPIETAPRDGTWFLAYSPDGITLGVARWHGGGWADSSDPYDDCHEWRLTHWQPLPTPPMNTKPVPAEGV